ncbi:MAG: HugZ family protein [Hassallia sp.]
MSKIEEAQAAYQNFTNEFQSLILSSVNQENQPNASYAPFVMDEAKNFYIFVSGLSPHTRNLYANSQACILFIDDESKTEQIFARRRLTFDCSASLIERETAEWNQIANSFEERFGDMIQVFRGLADFRIFKLTPHEGRFVVGFGAAYQITADDFNSLKHIKG